MKKVRGQESGEPYPLGNRGLNIDIGNDLFSFSTRQRERGGGVATASRACTKESSATRTKVIRTLACGRAVAYGSFPKERKVCVDGTEKLRSLAHPGF